MTLDELLAREAIRDTMARCTQAGDSGQWDGYADSFTEHGIIQSERPDGALSFRHEGREAIRAWQRDWKSRPRGEGYRPDTSFAQHCLSTCRIDFDGAGRAQVRTYWFVMTDADPDHAGYYLDDFEASEGRWLIAWRRVRSHALEFARQRLRRRGQTDGPLRSSNLTDRPLGLARDRSR